MSFLIFGGTFDPMHVGHLIMAEAARVQCNFKKVIFIPTYAPPHKSKMSDFEKRYGIATMMTASNFDFSVSRVEKELYERKVAANMKPVIYAIDIVNEMLTKTADKRVDMLVGGDSLKTIRNWYKAEELLSKVRLHVVQRPGYDTPLFPMEEYPTNVLINFIDVPQFSVSSTEIRDRVERGKSIRYMVPDGFEVVIEKMYKKDKDAAANGTVLQ